MLNQNYFDAMGINPDTKVVFVSHNDLDGVGPIIIGKNYFKDCKYFTVANKAVDKMVKLVLFSPDFADRELILITDCSVTDESIISYINKENQSKCGRTILLFDHHGTASGLNKYDWAHVTDEVGVSGTKLLWKYLQEDFAMSFDTQIFVKLDNLVNKISDYDTWQWVEKNDRDCFNLSNLFTNTGVEYFIQKYTGTYWYSYNEFEIFNSSDTALLKDIETKDKYLVRPAITKSARLIKNFEFEMPDRSIFRKDIKCVTINTAVGEMAELLYEDGVDYIMFFYPDAISVRSRVDDIDLGAWVKQFGGGGHVRSAGCPINKDNFYIYENYLKIKFLEEN